MAITVSIDNYSIGIDPADGTNKINLALSSTNTNKPGETITAAMSFATNLTAGQIKTQIDDAVTLAWTAASTASWQI